MFSRSFVFVGALLGMALIWSSSAEAFGCLARRVFDPNDIADAIAWARAEADAKRVPVIVEVITERVTNIAMGPEIDAITEFEETIDLPAEAVEPETV